MRVVILALHVIACGNVFCACARSDPPSLLRISPPGGQRGTTVVAECVGEFSWPLDVWAPGVSVRVDEEKGRLHITVPRNLPLDRIWLRLFNQEGARAPRPFLIGELPECEEHEPNDALASAQTVFAAAPAGSSNGAAEQGSTDTGTGITVNGALQARGDVDSFAVPMQAGETLIAALDANTRLGSPIDAVLQIATADGIVLAENHDTLGLDPRLVYTASSSGDYFVRLFAFPSQPGTRIEYHGGDDCVYRLTLTTGPFLTHTVPLCLSLTQPVVPHGLGWNLPEDLKLAVRPFGGEHHDYCERPTEFVSTARHRWLGFTRTADAAGAARIPLTRYPVCQFSKSSSEETPLGLKVPSVLSGHLPEPQTEDRFQVALEEGQAVEVSVASLELGFPMVPRVDVADPSGGTVAETPESGAAKDALLKFAAKQPGVYTLRVRDRYGHGGARHFYQLTICQPETDFELVVDTDSVSVSRDEPAELPVTIKRKAGSGNAIGKIQIRATGLPPWITSTTEVSRAEGETAKEVTLTLTTTGLPFSGPIRIQGTAEQPEDLERLALTRPVLGARHDHIWLTSKTVSPSPEGTEVSKPRTRRHE